MADDNKVSELEKKITELQQANAELTNKLSQGAVKASEDKIAELEGKINELNTKVTVSEAEVNKLKSDLQAKVDELNAAQTEKNNAVKAYDDMMKKNKKEKRAKAFQDLGFEDAEVQASTFENLDDAQFDGLLALFAKNKDKDKANTKECASKKTDVDASVDQTLNQGDKEKSVNVVSDKGDQNEQIRADIAKEISSFLPKKKNKETK